MLQHAIKYSTFAEPWARKRDLDSSVDIFEDLDMIIAHKVAAVSGSHPDAFDWRVLVLGIFVLEPLCRGGGLLHCIACIAQLRSMQYVESVRQVLGKVCVEAW